MRNRNKKIVGECFYADSEYARRIERWTNRVGDISTAKFISSHITDIASEESMLSTYNFIIRMFKSRGFSEEEAKKYMAQNKFIFQATRGRIINILSLADITSLGDEAFFENTRLVTSKHSLEKIYSAIRELLAKGKTVSVDEIILYLNLKGEELDKSDYKLTNVRMKVLSNCYISNLLKKEEEQKQLQSSEVKRVL